MALEFRQVDVFSSEPLRGNPVAVVHGAEGLGDEQMAALARWTNLSETTFLLEPTDPSADYRLRIFTPGGELPFAGHPTLGSAHAWLEAGGIPHTGRIFQECQVGLVEIARHDGRLAFAAPPLIRGDAPSPDEVAAAASALGLAPAAVVDARWCDNGPGWLGLRLASAAAVLALKPDPAAIGDQKIGVVGLDLAAEDGQAEVRAFIPGAGILEDPVTGSLNAALGQWLAGTALPASYVARQGTALQRSGRVHVRRDDTGTVWVGGDTRTTILGTLDLA